MASQAYTNWTNAVSRNGGRVVQPATAPINPNTGKREPPTVLSAAYLYTVWGPKANTKEWPIPNEFSANGQTGYYHAPGVLQAEAKTFSSATKQEIETGADALMDKWGVPFALRGLRQYFGTLTLIALVALGAYVVVTGRKASHG